MQQAIFLGLLPFVAAIPAPAPIAEPTAYDFIAVRAPEPTGAPELDGRDLLDDVHTYVDGIISKVDSKVSGYLDSGILDFPNGFPTGTAVQSSLGVSDSDLAALPTQVLNVP